MSLFPKVQSPCPYKSQLAAVMDGDFCRMCERQVFDLTAMSDAERGAFLAGCGEEACVSYRLPLRTAIVAAALAASAVAMPAGAQQPAPEPDVEFAGDAETSDMVIIVGGIKDPANAEMVAVAEDESVPELPVVYEGDASAAAPATPPGPPAG